MSENLSLSKNFEQRLHHEIEQKFIPLFPEKMSEFREEARPIEQFYLSHPDEPFSLRMREILDDNGALTYSATLKDRGEMTDSSIDRLEVEVPISPELYSYYKSDMPLVRKLRAEPIPDVAVDFYDDRHVQIESENPESWHHFTSEYSNDFVDVTGDHIVDNERRAHMNYRQEHGGQQALEPSPELDPDRIVRDILDRYDTGVPVFIKICGRSGSGKSTIVREVQTKLAERGLTSTVISTDDYHRGTSWLRNHNNGQEWTEWDAEIVYNTAAMVDDLVTLRRGQPISHRSIDWTVAEPVMGDKIQPEPVVIIEGIYAGHANFDGLGALRYDIPTPLATCIGRRLLRDQRSRPEFADPEKSLKYMLEQAEPAWREQNA